MSAPPEVFYHYTCADHGAPGIEADGFLRPNAHPMLRALGPVVWLTDLDHLTDPKAVGLTSATLSCDRTAIRYVVFAADVVGLTWWPFARSVCDRAVVADLESMGYPSRWWITRENVPIRRTA
jgi:hypothetical protein